MKRYEFFCCTIFYNLSKDKQYAILLSKQYDLVKNNIEKIVAQAIKVYHMRVGVGKLSDLNPYQALIKNQCCDFQLLELMKSGFFDPPLF